MAAKRMTARRFLANEIKLAREAKGISREKLARVVFVSEALVRAWESGKRLPQPDHLKKVEEVLGTGGILTRMREDLVKSEPLPEYVGRWREIEDQASSVLWFQPLVVPGIFQTPEYAREIIEKSGRSIENVDDHIQARMERQKILAPENSLMFVAVIDEGVLYRPIGGATVMREQILKLLELAEQPNIRIQIAKLDVGAYPGLSGGFGIASMDGREYAYVDDAYSGDVLEHPEQVEVMKEIWLKAHADACSATDSIELLKKALQRWEA